MNFKTKRDQAVDFIRPVRAMDPETLNRLISKEAGEDLAQFFFSYSASLITKDSGKVLENTSALMLMGYLIRSYEEKVAAPAHPMLQPVASA